MKNLYYLFFIVFLFVIISCGSNQNKNDVVLLDFNDYAYAGEIHNSYLSHIQEVADQIDTTVSSMEEAIANVVHLLKGNSYISETYNSGWELSIEGFIEEHKNFINQIHLQEWVTSDSLESLILKAYADGFLDDFEKELFEWAINPSTFELSDSEFEAKILEYKNLWLARGYEIESNKGRMSAIALNLTLYSIDWWKNYSEGSYDYINPDGSRIAGFLIADFVGGVGSVLYAHYSDALDTPECPCDAECPCCYGDAFVGGAVSASTGYAGKIAGWIKKWF